MLSNYFPLSIFSIIPSLSILDKYTLDIPFFSNCEGVIISLFFFIIFKILLIILISFYNCAYILSFCSTIVNILYVILFKIIQKKNNVIKHSSFFLDHIIILIVIFFPYIYILLHFQQPVNTVYLLFLSYVLIRRY